MSRHKPGNKDFTEGSYVRARKVDNQARVTDLQRQIRDLKAQKDKSLATTIRFLENQLKRLTK